MFINECHFVLKSRTKIANRLKPSQYNYFKQNDYNRKGYFELVPV